MWMDNTTPFDKVMYWTTLSCSVHRRNNIMFNKLHWGRIGPTNSKFLEEKLKNSGPTHKSYLFLYTCPLFGGTRLIVYYEPYFSVPDDFQAFEGGNQGRVLVSTQLRPHPQKLIMLCTNPLHLGTTYYNFLLPLLFS